jgi:alpha-glucosidase
VLGNHDQKRIASRVGAAEARVAAMLLLTLRGTPTLYYGDELGLENTEIPPDLVQDPWEKNEPGLGLGRDPARTPMPWDGSENAGFTTGMPWLPLNRDWATRNVAALTSDRRSLVALYRHLIALRRQHPALHAGRYIAIRNEGSLFAFQRCRDAKEHLLVALNLGREPRRLTLPDDIAGARLLLSTELDREGEEMSAKVELRPAEGLILELRRD